MISNKTKKSINLLVLAVLSAMSQAADAADQSTTLFDFRQTAQSVQADPADTAGTASSGIATPMGYAPIIGGSPYEYFYGLRVAGKLDWLKKKETRTYSAPNLAGQRRMTLTCAMEFHNPLTGALVYQTPVLSNVSGLIDQGFLGLLIWSAGCGSGYLTQAGNPRPLLVETVHFAINNTLETTVKIRVMSVAGVTGTVKWTAVFGTTLTLGEPWYGGLIDVNGDGTDELVIQYGKNVTPAGFAGSQTQYTRQVRNGLTNALIAQQSWIETYTRSP